METVTAVVERLRLTLAELGEVSLATLPLPRRDETVIALGVLALLALAALLARAVVRARAGRTHLVLPTLLPSAITRRSSLAPLRHAPFLLVVAGMPFFAVALADPHTALIQERATFPGHRIAILIDASLSMDSSFATDQLGWGNTFLANVAAAEYFVRRRMEGSHRDLVSLVQFGGEAYVVTPFTNDYENVLLSIGLIGTPEEYDRFPDHGTLIMRAISRGVQLFSHVRFSPGAGQSDGRLQRRTGHPRRLRGAVAGRDPAGGGGQLDSRVLHPHRLRSRARRRPAGHHLEAGRREDRRPLLSRRRRGRDSCRRCTRSTSCRRGRSRSRSTWPTSRASRRSPSPRWACGVSPWSWGWA